MTVLHINSSARFNDSNTRILGQYLVDALGGEVITRDLAREPLPAISAEDLLAVHGSTDSTRASYQQQRALSDTLINELVTADTLVLGVPIYNFAIPAILKQWVDAICRAGISFKYTERGPVGLLDIKQAYIITASGGTPVGSDIDFASTYLEHISHFIGVKEVLHIDASGSKRSPEQILIDGRARIDSLVPSAWAVDSTGGP